MAADGDLRSRRRGLPADRRPGQSRPTSPSRWPRARGPPASRIIEDCAVTGYHDRSRAASRGVETAEGTIACEVVVNCAGQWAREIGALAGVTVPLQSVQHQYLITEPIAGVPRDLPTLRDPDRLIYFKEEVGGLVMGGYEPNPIAWALTGIPEGFHFALLDSDWDHFEPHDGARRWPACRRSRRPASSSMINGPESFTPDGNFILGEAPELRQLLSSAPASTPSASHRRRRRPGAGGMGRRRRAADGSLARRHPALRPAAPRPALGAGPHARGLWQALHHGLAA